MKKTEQMQGLSVHDHGLAVVESYKNLIDDLNNGKEVIDPIITTIYEKLKDKILPDEITLRYQEFHDCGKPLCLYFDEEGRRHFPDHANISYNIWKQLFPQEIEVQELIKHDMDFHTLKGEELDKLWNSRLAPTLYFTAWAEIIANSKMFGGFDSTSFKIKKKKLIQAGKKYLNK